MNTLYQFVAQIEILFFLLCMEKYIFLGFFKETALRKTRILICVSLCICTISAIMENWFTDIGIVVVLLLYVLWIFALERNQKISKILHLIPILGILCSVCMIPAGCIYFGTGDMNEMLMEHASFSIVLDVFTVVFILLFLVLGKQWRIRFAELVKDREMEAGERRLVSASGILLIIFSILCVSIDEYHLTEVQKKVMVLLFLVIMLLLNVFVLVIMMQRNQRFYYMNQADLNRFYLNAQIEHFRNYRSAQQETRKVKHDMKNHCALLLHLLQEEKFDEVTRYIYEINEKVQEIDNEVYTGNEIADAILNAKNVKAKELNNEIVVMGTLAKDFPIETIDLCTILSNALDNAIEELQRCNIEHQFIELSFQKQDQVQMILVKNPVGTEKRHVLNEKKDVQNHGFGLINMQDAVRKYDGIMRTFMEADTTGKSFVLEILFTQNVYSQQKQNHSQQI